MTRARRHQLGSWMATLVCAALQAACGSDAPQPYSGTAYPDQRPAYVANGHLLGYVANGYSDSVSVVDLDTFSVLGHAPVGRDPVDIDGPRNIQLDPNRGLAYVVLSYPLSVLSPHALEEGATERPGYVQQLSLSTLAIVGEQHVDPRVTSLSLSPDAALLAAAHNTERGMLFDEVDRRRADVDLIAPAWGMQDDTAVVRRVRTCVAPAAVVHAGNPTRAFVACAGEGSIAVVDLENAQVLSRVRAGDAPVVKPLALARNPDGTQLLVANQVAFRVGVFSAQDTPELQAQTTSLMGVPFTPGFVSATEFLVPIQSPHGAVLASVATGEIILQRAYTDDECAYPSEVIRSADGRVFMVCEGNHFASGAIVELDVNTLDVTRRVGVQAYPDHLALLEPSNN